MKKNIYFLLLSIPFIVNGQSTKKIKNKISDNSIEIFYALKSDNSHKQGSYKLFESKKLKVSGNYLENKKNGIWKTYHKNSTKSTEGNYEKGKRIGIWSFFNNRDELIQTYNFEKEILTNEGPFKEKEIVKIGNGKYRGLVFSDKNPEFKNGKSDLINFIKKNYNYSELTKISSSKGTIYIGAILNKDGTLTDINILRGINDILDLEALRVTKLMNEKWNPAEFEGEKIAKKIVIPFLIK
ncbi:energy transducer TonB [Tenacibaculum ovolyticum]|uniref:energy transducer TonB n=1 Tax=Tenacibaculum ovolyticum TaxID=104270 RepID=UPI000403820C|nr:energy transducer TonB [Tenacibaculum ovolyticum]